MASDILPPHRRHAPSSGVKVGTPPRGPVRRDDPVFLEWLSHLAPRPLWSEQLVATLVAGLWQQSFTVGEQLVHRGDRAVCALFVATGLGRLELTEESGAVHAVAAVKPGEVAGAAGASGCRAGAR